MHKGHKYPDKTGKLTPEGCFIYTVMKEEREGVKRQIQVVVPEVGVVVALRCEAAVCTWIRFSLPSWLPQGFLSRKNREMKINAQIRHTVAHVLALSFF